MPLSSLLVKLALVLLMQGSSMHYIHLENDLKTLYLDGQQVQADYLVSDLDVEEINGRRYLKNVINGKVVMLDLQSVWLNWPLPWQPFVFYWDASDLPKVVTAELAYLSDNKYDFLYVPETAPQELWSYNFGKPYLVMSTDYVPVDVEAAEVLRLSVVPSKHGPDKVEPPGTYRLAILGSDHVIRTYNLKLQDGRLTFSVARIETDRQDEKAWYFRDVFDTGDLQFQKLREEAPSTGTIMALETWLDDDGNPHWENFGYIRALDILQVVKVDVSQGKIDLLPVVYQQMVLYVIMNGY